MPVAWNASNGSCNEKASAFEDDSKAETVQSSTLI